MPGWKLLAPLAAANLAAWGLAWGLLHGDPALLGAAVLAYTLGCRHAVDADHIAAIDNATRKLMASGGRPAATGLWFSLGHSAVVWIASIGVALAAGLAGSRLDVLRQFGGGLGTTISALFLLGIAAGNAVVLASIVAAIRRPPQSGAEPVERYFAPKGLYTRLFLPVFRMVSKSRHMFVVGVLFGLGFDTASEIGLLGLSAAAAGGGLPVWFILVFPALFTAGMSLIDTLDSVVMTRAYGWALAAPSRRLYYNLTITFASVVVALVVGGIELMSLIDRGMVTGALVAAAAIAAWLAWSAWRGSRRTRSPAAADS